MGWTVEGTVSEDGAIRVKDMLLRPGARVTVSGEDEISERAADAGYGMLRGTGRIVGDIVSPRRPAVVFPK